MKTYSKKQQASIMKLTITFLIAILPFIAFGQRGDVPTTNPDNALDLKVVFQEYSVTTYSKYGATSTHNSEYLNLKVNDLYLPGGGTGISAKHFDRYLSNCPKALNLSKKGLGMYDKRDKNNTYGNIAMLAGFGAGGYLLFTNAENFDTKKGPIVAGASVVLGGMLTKYLFGRRASGFKKKGDKMIVDAFDIYAETCFNSDLYSSEIEDSQPETMDAENGQNNNNENVLLDILSNNADSKFLFLGVTGTVSALDAFDVNIGPELSYFKKGFYVNAHPYYIKSIGEDVVGNDDFELGFSGLASVPFIGGKSKLKKARLELGRMQGINAVAVSKEKTDAYKTVGLDVGIDYNQKNVSQFSPEVNNYFIKSTTVRGGLSRSLFSETSFNIDDNRFSKEPRYIAVMARFYLHALYNLNTDYQFVQKPFGSNPSLDSELGYVLGMDFKWAGNSTNRAFSFVLEGGKYPLINSTSGWGAQLKLGYGIYSVDRAKTKKSSRGRSRSRR